MAEDIGKVISGGEGFSNIYYDEKSSHLKKSLDDVVSNNRFTQAFNSLQFGAQGISLLIPNDQLISDVIVAFRFPGITTGGGNALGIVPVPAYALIQQIEWQIAGSTIYQNNGIQHMYSVLADCQSLDKRNEVIRLAGGIGSLGGTAFQTTTTYYAHIKVPWSNINAPEFLKNPLDTKLVKQPIKVNIYLRAANAVYYSLTGTVTFPTALTEAYFQVHQYQFQDMNHHLKLKYEEVQNGMVVQKNDFYAYPFSFVQDFITQSFTGSAVGSTPVQIPLTGFRSGNLLSLRIMLFNLTTSSPLAVPATATTNFLACESPLSVSLFFNGLEMFRSKYDSWKMSNLENVDCPTFGRLTVSGTSSDYYWMDVPFAQWMSEIYGNGYQKGVNMSSQTLILQLNTNSTDTYICYGSYIYHSHAIMDGETADISFD